MHAVILAAGLGNRLGGLTADKPKALVKVAGRELILRVMDFLDHPSITERTVVTGYMAPMLEDFIASNIPGVGTVRNPHFNDGSIRSIEAALPSLKGDMLVVNVDHIYPAGLIERVVAADGDLVAVCDFDRRLGPDDMKVKLCENGRLELISKTLSEFDGGYIGMTRVAAAKLPAYREAAATVRREEGNSASVERVIGLMAARGGAVDICDSSGIRWLEVDTPEDLAAAEETLSTNPGYLT
ncbi:MAG TPA: phosphocholine cytidylyltransferase family protein [bacterium]|nr:phosphocholine cytidylyltransferase family protein [bacterium]